MKCNSISRKVIAFIIILAIFAGFIPCSDSYVYASGVDNITARADYLYNITWTAKKDINGWKNRFTYKQGTTYHIPYGQPATTGKFICWGASIDTFLAAAADASSVFYTARSYNEYVSGSYSTYYAMDCSAFASFCWGLSSRTTTSGWSGLAVTNYGNCTSANVGKIQQGDVLNHANDHIVVLSRVSDGKYEVTEQTPYEMKRTSYTASQLVSKYSNYTIYRYKNRDNVPPPPNVPSCTCSTAYAGEYICTVSSGNNLTIRSGHGTSYSELGKIPSGATVYVSKASGTSSSDWAHVTYNGVSGYASMQYLRKKDVPVNCYLDINGWIDGTPYADLMGHGTVDVYINGSCVADDVNDFYQVYPKGTKYEIKDIKSLGGYSYNGVHSGGLSGTLNDSITVMLDFSSPQNYSLDINGWIDGTPYADLMGHGTVDVYINGNRVADDVNDFYQVYPKGTKYEIKDIKSLGGYSYNGVHSGGLSGTLNDSITVMLDFSVQSGNEMTVGYDRVLPDGDYAIVCHADRNYQLDIAGDEFPAEINANIQLYQVGSSYREQDIFTLKYNETDKFYTIAQKGTSMFLDVWNNSKQMKTNVQIHTGNGTDAQKWAISEVWNGDTWLGYRIQAKSSGYSLDIENANISNETNVFIYENNNSAAQLWSFIPYRPQQPVANGSYVLISALDPSIELDVSGDFADAPNGSNVQIWHDTAPSQYNSFDIVKLDNGYYKFYHTGSRRLLDVDKASMELGTNVQLWEETGSNAQQWAIIPYNDGYVIVAGCSGLVLDVAYGKAEDGANVWQHSFNGSNAQIWKFKKAQNTISYDANWGTNAPSQQKKYYGATVTLRTELPTRNGYTFVNWNTKEDGTGTSYAAGGAYSANSDLTLYAQWKANPITYTVSYDANGGSGAPSSQTKTHGTTLTLSSQKPTRSGYNFVKWTTNSDGSGTSYYPSGQYTANAAVTLYAQWESNTYTVSYNANGGSGAPGNQTKIHGTALTLSSQKPTRSGYIFVKWTTNSDGSGTSYDSGGQYTANAAVTLYAQWEVQSVTLSQIAVKSKPNNLTYTVGDSLNTSGLKLTATYSNGSTKEISSGFTYTPIILNTAGTQKITVTYNGKTTSFDVTVNPAIVDTNALKINVSSANAKPGDEVSVTISLADNPGFNYMKLKVKYDKNAMSLSSTESLNLLDGFSYIPGSNTASNPYVLSWGAAGDSKKNGNLVKLTFKISANAGEGEYPITLTCEDCSNRNDQDVKYQITSGKVSINNKMIGDVNGDGKINGKDATLLMKYLAEWDVTIDKSTSDVNKDGKINGKDATLLMKYLAEWDVTLG